MSTNIHSSNIISVLGLVAFCMGRFEKAFIFKSLGDKFYKRIYFLFLTRDLADQNFIFFHLCDFNDCPLLHETDLRRDFVDLSSE